jgi:16S rRNA (adenine1518-N6/adenine1519-N6)-dimethyltransferase
MLKRLDLRARKSLGQHFLVNKEVLEKIIASAELIPEDNIIEVGPGMGILTKEIAKKAGFVFAIELDKRLANLLKHDFVASKNVAVINQDILKVNPLLLIKEKRADLSPREDFTINYKVVANLPYYITSAVLRHFLEDSSKPRLIVVMMQKEVAEAIIAKPGAMSLLSVSVQFYGEPKIISYIPAESFFPPPKVDSAILKIDVYSQPIVEVNDVSDFFKLVQAGFCAPRKQIGNSLAQGLGLPKVEALSLLEKADIISRRRAETLSIEEWQRLWKLYGGS